MAPRTFSCRAIAAAGLAIIFSTTVHADWLRFRGPNGSGISESDACAFEVGARAEEFGVEVGPAQRVSEYH